MKKFNQDKTNSFGKSLFIFLSIVNIAFLSIYIHLITYEINEKRSALKSSIYEYKRHHNTVDNQVYNNRIHLLKTLCASTGCDRFMDINNKDRFRAKENNDGYTFRTKEEYEQTKCSYKMYFGDLKVTSDLRSVIIIKGKDKINATFAYSLEPFLEVILHIFLISNTLLIMVFIYYYFNTYTRDEKEKLVNRMRLSGTLQEKNMKILTENIHHELNTPIAVISGYLKDYEHQLSIDDKLCKNACAQKPLISLDFETLYSSIEQVNTVLQRMNGFKQITYSNGNKSLFDIINYSANSMKIYKQSNFNYDIDQNFKKYTLSGDLSNGDFLNILSNFLRNSLEAKATQIKVQCKFNSKTNHIYIYIIDNGEGIFDKNTGSALQKENYKKIFEPYYSTKDSLGNTHIKIDSAFTKFIKAIKHIINKEDEEIQDSIRGVGLYLNKELLNKRGADLILEETSSRGTVFKLIVPGKIKKKGK